MTIMNCDLFAGDVEGADSFGFVRWLLVLCIEFRFDNFIEEICDCSLGLRLLVGSGFVQMGCDLFAGNMIKREMFCLAVHQWGADSFGFDL